MTYHEKRDELEALIAANNATIEKHRTRYHLMRKKYGATASAFARVPHGLYSERQRFLLELEGLDYIGDVQGLQE